MYAGHFFSAMCPCILKCITDNPGTGLSGDNFRCMNRIFINLLFHTHIQVFRVFPENHHIYIVKWRFHRNIRFCRTDIRIQVIFTSQGYIQGTESVTDRSCDRRLQ